MYTLRVSYDSTFCTFHFFASTQKTVVQHGRRLDFVSGPFAKPLPQLFQSPHVLDGIPQIYPKMNPKSHLYASLQDHEANQAN